jgi:hypothetical protein
MGQIIQDSSPLREDFMHALMGFLDKPGDLFVYLGGFGFTVIISSKTSSSANRPPKRTASRSSSSERVIK